LGEIDDEHDEEKEVVEEDMLLVKHENGSILIGARKDIYDLNEEFDLHLPESEAYTTLGGLIMYQEERIPQIGETVQIGHHTFSIVKSSENKIITVRLESVSSKTVIIE
jgi:CBS domain containing-hemolysin-like protein